MMGYVQQFHDEGGDAIDRAMWSDLTSKSDAALDRALAARITALIACAVLLVGGGIGMAVLPAGSVFAVPAIIAVFAGLLNGTLGAGGLVRVIGERRGRRWARAVESAPSPTVHLGVIRSHA